MIEEHIKTVEKSIKMINQLSQDEHKNYNQIVRWINNKEEHLEEIQYIIYQYFMTQRIKPVEKKNKKKYKKYIKMITTLHEMLVHSMKAKQSLKVDNVKKLRELTEVFEKLYF